MVKTRDVILFATADWDAPYWTNKQHTAAHLAKLGFRVLYIESVGLRAPTVNRKDIKRIWQRLKRGIFPPRHVEKDIWVFSPLIIPFKHHWQIIRKINQSILSWQLKSFIKRQQFQKTLIWTYHPFILETVSNIHHSQIIYHCVDDLAAVPGIDANAFKKEEKRLLENCNAVFTTSETLYTQCANLNKNTHHFSNVADIKHFSKAQNNDSLPSELAAIPTPRIGYIGALSDYKINFELILTIAKKHPEWHWILIGDEREGQENKIVAELRKLSNVHFLGYRPYSVLPDYLRGCDVATLPSLLNEYTRAMFPMKYFEYLAAGVPVVSTSLEFTKTHTAGLEVGDTPEDFALGIERQLKRGRLTNKEIELFVADNTWEERLKKMLNKINMEVNV